jgi:hypothetical protein
MVYTTSPPDRNTPLPLKVKSMDALSWSTERVNHENGHALEDVAALDPSAKTILARVLCKRTASLG